MDDFNIAGLKDSGCVWSRQIVRILTPCIIEGINLIMSEAVKLCTETREYDKISKTFQNLLSRIPKWNTYIIRAECDKIIKTSGVGYLEELITCVHIIQLKVMTAIRAGQKQKKIDIDIPKLEDFVHKVYIQVARKAYTYAYLFEPNIAPLKRQERNRMFEMVVKECIVNVLDESMPVESILHAYMDESCEEHVTEEIVERVIGETPLHPTPSFAAASSATNPATTNMESFVSASARDTSTSSEFLLPTTDNRHEETKDPSIDSDFPELSLDDVEMLHDF